MKLNVLTVLTLVVLLVIAIIALMVDSSIFVPIWENIEKVGAAATAIALIYVIRQSTIARKAAETTELANQENLYQQMFNLMLEQHNNEMNNIKSWINDKELAQSSSTHASVILNNTDTQEAVLLVRGHAELSPYMRLLHHTLKTIKSDEYRKRIVGNFTPVNKKYASLVRSFIPGELLKLVAINAMITNDAYAGVKDHGDYYGYNFNLKYYDFFEHLHLNKVNSTFYQVMAEFSNALTEGLSFKFMNRVGLQGVYYRDHVGRLSAHNNSSHQDAIHDLFSRLDFCIAFFYDLPGKYMLINEEFNTEKTFCSNLKSHIHHSLALAFTSRNVVSDVFALHIIKRLDFICDTRNFILEDSLQAQAKSNRPFLRDGEGSLREWLKSNIKLDTTLDNLFDIRNNLHDYIDNCISYCALYDKGNPLYDENLERITAAIYEDSLQLLDQIIKLKYAIEDNATIVEVYNEIKNETLKTIGKYTQGIS